MANCLVVIEASEPERGRERESDAKGAQTKSSRESVCACICVMEALNERGRENEAVRE